MTKLLKRTYALPSEAIEDFEKEVATGKRSAAIAQMLQEWLDRRRTEQLRREVIEGCRAMAHVYQDLEREFHPLEEEVSRALEA